MLKISNVSKSYNGVRVLEDFSLQAEAGEVHALLGHNGSGKSTFVKILAGYIPPDIGSESIELGSRKLQFGRPMSSNELGIRIVHQNLSLLPDLTVLENLRLGISMYRRNFVGKIDWNWEYARALEELATVGLDGIDPSSQVKRLLPVERAGIAISRALHDATGVLQCLVLDEPTAFMPMQEVARLREIIKRLKSYGVTVIYVTHRLEEVAMVADAVTVLRDGAVVGQGVASKFSVDELSNLVGGIEHINGATGVRPRTSSIGHEWPDASIPSGQDPEDDIEDGSHNGSMKRGLQLIDINSDGLDHLSLRVDSGEVLAVMSLMGGGATEVARLLRGQVHYKGEIVVAGEVVSLTTHRHIRNAGVVVVGGGAPSNLLEKLSVNENATLGLETRFCRWGHFSRTLEGQLVDNILRQYSIRGRRWDRSGALSGGNRQKLAMARAIEMKPRVLVALEPTTGVDVAGRADILAALRKTASVGVPVLICTSDVNDVIGVADRVVVLSGGRLVGELAGSEMSHAEVLRRLGDQ